MHARLLMVTAAASLALAGTAAAAPSDRYTVRNMVSNDTTIVPAERADPLLVNPWGLAASADVAVVAGQPGLEHVDDHAGDQHPQRQRSRDVPGGPTGVVRRRRRHATSRSPARRPDRRTSSSTRWAARSAAGAAAFPNNDSQLGISRASVGAVYMGLTIATPSAATGPRLYAADFANNRIDIVNAQWQLVDAPGAFVDPNLPAGYGAYGIQTVGNRIIVTYAREGPGRHPRAPGRRARRRQRVRPQRQLPGAHREPGRRPERAVGHRAGASELRRLRRRPADRQLRRRPHQRVPRERQRHVDAERHAEGEQRPAAVHRRPVGAAVRQGQRRQRRASTTCTSRPGRTARRAGLFGRITLEPQ